MRVLPHALPLLLLAALAAGPGGCRSSTEPPPLKPFPIQLRSVVPGDSVRVDTPALTLSAGFNQEMAGRTVHLQVQPPPLELGEAVPHGRSVDWQLRPADGSPICWLLLDGPDFLRPYLRRFYRQDVGGDFIFPAPDVAPCFIEGDPGWVGTIGGRVFCRSDAVEDSRYALVLAYEAADVGERGPMAVFADLTPAALALAELPGTQEGWYYTLGNLVIGRSYAVMAVLDTSGDGIHDPARDWWAWAHELGVPLWIWSTAHIGPCAPRRNLELIPPGG